MSKQLNTRDYLKRLVKFANKKVGYPVQKGKYFLGSLPPGTVFETNSCRGILLDSSVNARVQIFDVRKGNLEDNEYAKALVGKSIWAWATEVSLVRLGKLPEGDKNERMDTNIR
jgi:hypothetical protein